MRVQRRFAYALLLCAATHIAQGQDALPVGAKARLGGRGALNGFLDGEYIAKTSLSLDGKLLAVCAGNQYALIDPATGKTVRLLESNPRENRLVVTKLAISPNGKYVVAGINGRSIRVWDASTGKISRNIDYSTGRQTAMDLCFSADGKTLAWATLENATDAHIHAWNIETGPMIRSMKSPHDNVSLSRDGSLLAIWGSTGRFDGKGGTLKILSTSDGKELRRIVVDPDWICHTAIAPDGKSFAIAVGASAYHVYSMETGKELHRFRGQTPGHAMIQYSPDGKLLAAAESGGAQLWNADTGKRIAQVDLPKGLILSIGFPAPEKAVVFGSHGQSYYVADLAQGAAPTAMPGHYYPVTSLAYSADGKQIVSATGGKIIWWDLDAKKESRHLFVHEREGQEHFNDKCDDDPLGSPRGVKTALSPSGTFFARIDRIDPDTARIWDTDNRRALGDIVSDSSVQQHGIAFSADGRKFIISGPNQTAAIWDIESSRKLVQLGQPPANQKITINSRNFSPVRVALSPDGGYAALSTQFHEAVNGTPKLADVGILWDARTGREIRREMHLSKCKSFGTAGAAFSSDGVILASGKQGVVLIESATGKDIRPLEGDRETSPVDIAFSPDGRTIAVATLTVEMFQAMIDPKTFSTDYDIRSDLRVFETATGSLRFKLPGHGCRVNCLAFSPDCRTLASGGDDATILLWDMFPPTTDAQAQTPDQAWATLAEPDAVTAWATIRRLAAVPDEAMRVLRGRLKLDDGSRVESKQIEKLIADLGHDVFAVRERARRGLLSLGEHAIPALQGVLKSDPPLEVRRRAEDVLRKLKPGMLTSDEFRNIRALEIFERVGTPDARD